MLILLTAIWIRLSAIADAFEHFTLYFETNIHGLSVGAPVRMNGQNIGQVSSIEIVSVPRTPSVTHYAAVTIRLKSGKLRKLINLPPDEDFEECLPGLLEAGLRGQLRMPSLLANGLCLDLYFARGQPASTANVPDALYPEIPTNYKSTSDLVDQANTFIETKKLREIADKIRTLKTILSALNETIDDIDCDALNEQILTALSLGNDTLSQAAVMQHISALNRELSTFCDALAQKRTLSQEELSRFRDALKNAGNALKSISESAETLQALLDSDVKARQEKFLENIRTSLKSLLRY